MHRALASALLLCSALRAAPAGAWTFAVSGDSRNCGDVVMPVIAAKAKADKAAFYWHLGDLRKSSELDEDIQYRLDDPAPASLEEYQKTEWDDFQARQLKAFDMPFFLGIGNHETIKPKTREEFTERFKAVLDTATLRSQRLADDPKDEEPHAYFHWRDRGLDFISLDNATAEQFDDAQLAWFEGVVSRAETDKSVKTLVVGMHEALPHSLTSDHSMDQSARGTESGEKVYARLLKAQKAGKRVYVLASHSHFFMTDSFNTEHWKKNGGILPGWIVGTGGAFRYKLPDDAGRAKQALTAVYGYLLGNVSKNGKVDFRFHQLGESDVTPDVLKRYDPKFVHWCWAENRAGSEKAKPF